METGPGVQLELPRQLRCNSFMHNPGARVSSMPQMNLWHHSMVLRATPIKGWLDPQACAIGCGGGLLSPVSPSLAVMLGLATCSKAYCAPELSTFV